MEKDKVIIVGAGIAGLSLAIQLTENKIDCLVLEDRVHFDGPSSGVRISAQGVEILAKMNIHKIGKRTCRTIMHYGKLTTDFAIADSPGGQDAILVTRRAVHEKLMEKVRLLNIEIVSGFKLADIYEQDDIVVAISKNGDRLTGGLLVGADGVGSVVRKILNPGQKSGKTYAGYLGVGLIAPSNRHMEMSLYQHPGDHVGVASIGKIDSVSKEDNLFLWTHLYMTEERAKGISDEQVMQLMDARQGYWSNALKEIYTSIKISPELVLAHGPVYNGRPPANWFSKNMILIGDAAHPYGPGGQGISMALKDADTLCKLIVAGNLNEENKKLFQHMRGEEAQKLGESAEVRNRPENQSTSNLGIFLKGVMMKVYYLFNGGILKNF